MAAATCFAPHVSPAGGVACSFLGWEVPTPALAVIAAAAAACHPALLLPLPSPGAACMPYILCPNMLLPASAARLLAPASLLLLLRWQPRLALGIAGPERFHHLRHTRQLQ